MGESIEPNRSQQSWSIDETHLDEMCPDVAT